jgi:hypothetical protein
VKKCKNIGQGRGRRRRKKETKKSDEEETGESKKRYRGGVREIVR